jgi:hypothetical protein
MIEKMLEMGTPRPGFDWDDSEWRGLGPEPWWFKQCSRRVRQRYIEQAVRRRMWKGGLKKKEALHLSLANAHPFGCKNLVHFAVALADLECTVRVTDGDESRTVHIGRGRITWLGRDFFEFAAAPPTLPGWPIHFDVTGPDAEKAIPVIRKTFEEGLKDHLAVMRKFIKLQRQTAF